LLVGLGVVGMMQPTRMEEQVKTTITGSNRSILVTQAMRLDIAVLEREAWAATTAGTNLNPTIAGAWSA